MVVKIQRDKKITFILCCSSPEQNANEVLRKKLADKGIDSENFYIDPINKDEADFLKQFDHILNSRINSIDFNKEKKNENYFDTKCLLKCSLIILIIIIIALAYFVFLGINRVTENQIKSPSYEKGKNMVVTMDLINKTKTSLLKYGEENKKLNENEFKRANGKDKKTNKSSANDKDKKSNETIDLINTKKSAKLEPDQQNEKKKEKDSKKLKQDNEKKNTTF